MNTASSAACSCIRTRSPSSAPPVNGEVGSTASTATRWPAARYAATSALVAVDLPTPGAPVRPTIRAPPVAGRRSLMTERTRGDSSSTRDRSRARARVSPARAALSVSAVLISDTGRLAVHPEQQRLALPAAAAQPGRAEPAAAAAEFVAQVHREPGAGCPDRVADGDRAAA